MPVTTIEGGSLAFEAARVITTLFFVAGAIYGLTCGVAEVTVGRLWCSIAAALARKCTPTSADAPTADQAEACSPLPDALGAEREGTCRAAEERPATPPPPSPRTPPAEDEDEPAPIPAPVASEISLMEAVADVVEAEEPAAEVQPAAEAEVETEALAAPDADEDAYDSSCYVAAPALVAEASPAVAEANGCGYALPDSPTHPGVGDMTDAAAKPAVTAPPTPPSAAEVPAADAAAAVSVAVGVEVAELELTDDSDVSHGAPPQDAADSAGSAEADGVAEVGAAVGAKAAAALGASGVANGSSKARKHRRKGAHKSAAH
ncbi:hypothetical protein HYH03_000403 [Edaphochlamys debaryana]|uniref:Uncharacterized protein n=1 Tax=Edaphochlamys debaryana TaxID=47281 RepID=A0A835YNW9_9CHLO|nr:hypothetical protein HYH03_000403 [Edaphochlamys debaryana]|eukprot:KAG2501905.1 hypothetical protein HYH03_000403 [Edaphochlamys debaryana]